MKVWTFFLIPALWDKHRQGKMWIVVFTFSFNSVLTSLEAQNKYTVACERKSFIGSKQRGWWESMRCTCWLLPPSPLTFVRGASTVSLIWRNKSNLTSDNLLTWCSLKWARDERKKGQKNRNKLIASITAPVICFNWVQSGSSSALFAAKSFFPGDDGGRTRHHKQQGGEVMKWVDGKPLTGEHQLTDINTWKACSCGLLVYLVFVVFIPIAGLRAEKMWQAEDARGEKKGNDPIPTL